MCVIGAGIAGLSAAYQLARAGRSVVVLDDGPIGGGQTGRTTAHLSHAMDVQYQAIQRLHGEQGARLAADSHTAAIDEIERIASEEGIACDFERVPGHLFVARDESSAVLERELEATRAAGLSRVELLPATPGLGAHAGPCLRFPHQAQFHPLRYLAGLAAAIERHGGHVFTHVHAEAVEAKGSTQRVKTRGRRHVDAGAVIAATNAPILGPQAIHAKQAAYLSYVIGARVPAGTVPHGLYWDTEDPYHYVRLQRRTPPAASEVLIVGGEDHKTGQADDSVTRYRALEEWARERFPMIEEVEFRWSGQVMNSLDGLAFIGPASKDEPDVYLATGDTGMGMTHGTIAGMLLRDLILGRDNPWRTLYDPSRLILRSLPTLVRENVNVAAQYADWITPGRGLVGGRHRARSGRAAAARPRQDRGLPGCRRAAPRTLRGVPASGLHRRLELGGENLGLPVPRLALRRGRARHQRTGQCRPGAGGGHVMNRAWGIGLAAVGIGASVAMVWTLSVQAQGGATTGAPPRMPPPPAKSSYTAGRGGALRGRVQADERGARTT